MTHIKVLGGSTQAEIDNRKRFLELLKSTPIPDDELLGNLGLFLSRQTLSRILFMHELYQKIINVHGVVIEFGVRWGQNLALFESFRGIYEPYNFNRKIIGFDTFSGFPEIEKMEISYRLEIMVFLKTMKVISKQYCPTMNQKVRLRTKKSMKLLKGTQRKQLMSI
jgi:hypothetical protein